MVYFMWNLLIFNFKGVFLKTENLLVSTFYLRISWFTNSEIFRGCSSENGSTNFAFSLVIIITAKMLSLFPWKLLQRVENSCSPKQNQNINLVNSLSFKSNWLLFPKIKCHKESFPHGLLRSLGIAIGPKILKVIKVLDFHFILLYYIKIWSILFLTIEFW